jgi:hypothetical protein
MADENETEVEETEETSDDGGSWTKMESLVDKVVRKVFEEKSKEWQPQQSKSSQSSPSPKETPRKLGIFHQGFFGTSGKTED